MSIVSVSHVGHTYPPPRKTKEPRVALRDVSFEVAPSTMFSLLGPNGSGKSTLFRILSTLLPLQTGDVTIRGSVLKSNVAEIRKHIGVVFQHPSLDMKLTAGENVMHQGHLYGLSGNALTKRISEVLEVVGIVDRKNDLVETLSGGMQRKVELAKSLVHAPSILFLDEPSTGLDPGARIEFGSYLRRLRDELGTTILLTTHILDEAEQSDTIAIFNKGSLVACNTPAALKEEIGGEIVSVKSTNPGTLAESVARQFSVVPQVIGNTLHIEWRKGAEFIPQLIQAFPGQIESVTLAKPTLDDVFIRKTGRSIWEENEITERGAA